MGSQRGEDEGRAARKGGREFGWELGEWKSLDGNTPEIRVKLLGDLSPRLHRLAHLEVTEETRRDTSGPPGEVDGGHVEALVVAKSTKSDVGQVGGELLVVEVDGGI